MNLSEFIGKFRSKYLWGNIIAIAAVVFALVIAVIIGMGIYTHHGEKIQIPDVRRHSFENAEKVLNDLGLNVEVSDTGYVKALPPGAVLEQTPAPGMSVKTGRTVYVVINALDTPMLTLPDIIDNSSYREAQAKLTSMGFKLGTPQYISGEKDWVYGIKVRGRELTKGDRVSVEDELVIVVGSGMRDASDTTLYVTDPEYDFPDEGTEDFDEFEIVQ